MDGSARMPGAPAPLRDPARLRRLLSPRSVAVIGVSADPIGFGAKAIANLAEFAGPVHAVNPKYAGQMLHGRDCVAALRDLPAPPDCVLIALPRTGVAAALDACIAQGAGGAIIFASGYGETGLPDRIAEEAALRDRVRAAGLPVLGVNCLGIVDHVRRAGVTFMPEYRRMTAPAAGVAITSQSGALGYALMQAAERGFGVCHLTTVGNATDLDVCDLAAYQLSMPECRAVALAVEGLGDGRRLALLGDAARAAGKPIVAMKLGRGAAGAAAAVSHTGSMAGSAAAWSAAFHAAGMIEVEDFDALLETAALFAKAPAPKAAGIAIVTPSGGAGIMAADHAEALGLEMPQPRPETEAVLRAAIPDFGAPRNPCDLTAQVASHPQMFEACMDAIMADPQYGAVVMPVVYSHYAQTPVRMETMRAYAARHHKPLLIAWLPEQLESAGAAAAEAARELILFRSMRRLLQGVRLWRDWHADRARPTPRPPAITPPRLPPGPGVLSEGPAKTVFAAIGIPVVEERRAGTLDAALAAALELGFPVALKLDSPDVAHKTEVGGVRLGLADPDALRVAHAAILADVARHAPGARVDGVLVQRMATRGVELILGARRDPQFGPMVLVGTGGVQAELFRDVSLALAPVDAATAGAMLRRLRGFPLLDGYRGAPRCDVDAIAAAVAAFSALIAAMPAIEEAEINPLICGPGGVLAVDGLLRLSA